MNTDKIANIAARVKLCSLTTGAWRATRLHRKESDKVNTDHGTGDAAKVHVRLTNSGALREINCLTAEAYDAHRTLTLPSVQDGLRLCPVGRELEHSDKMRDFGTRHAALVAQFLAEYDAERASAPIRLNGLYDARHWPHRNVIAEKFTFSTRYLACPTDGSWADWIGESADAAEAELRDHLSEALSRVAERCGTPDGKLYDTVFSNLREILALVPDFNVADRPDLAALPAACAELASLQADTIRDSKTARQNAAIKASSILAALGAQ